MTYLHDESGNRQRAAALLAEVLEEAKDIAVLKLLLGRTSSADPRVEWLAPGMVTGVHTYEAPDGWRCDLTLDGIPAGSADRIGTPGPMRDRHAAVTFAVFVLSEAFLIRPTPMAPPPPAPVPVAAPVVPPVEDIPDLPPGVAFEYAGLPVALSPRTVRELREAGMDHINERYVRKRLDEVGRDIAKGGPITHYAIERLSPDARRAFLTVCTMAALKGIVRWPEGGAKVARAS